MALDGTRRYSDRLGVISSSQIQRACDLLGLGTLEDAEPASTGTWGQNIFLSTTRGEFVLRGNPLEPQQLAKEKVVAAEITKRSTLRVPWPYEVCSDRSIFGWDFAIMPRLAGRMGADHWNTADDRSRLALASAHGSALAELHQATFAAPGPFDVELGAFVAVGDFRSWTLDRIDSLRERCRAVGGLAADAETYIDELIRECSDALSEPLVPVLVHHDFSLANTNYEVVGDGYRIVGLFDLGEAHVGDGEEDLVRFLFRRRRGQRAAFAAAYTQDRPLRSGAPERLSLYALADLLFMWEVSQRVTHWFGDATFVDTARPIIENARGAAAP